MILLIPSIPHFASMPRCPIRGISDVKGGLHFSSIGKTACSHCPIRRATGIKWRINFQVAVMIIVLYKRAMQRTLEKITPIFFGGHLRELTMFVLNEFERDQRGYRCTNPKCVVFQQPAQAGDNEDAAPNKNQKAHCCNKQPILNAAYLRGIGRRFFQAVLRVVGCFHDQSPLIFFFEKLNARFFDLFYLFVIFFGIVFFRVLLLIRFPSRLNFIGNSVHTFKQPTEKNEAQTGRHNIHEGSTAGDQNDHHNTHPRKRETRIITVQGFPQAPFPPFDEVTPHDFFVGLWRNHCVCKDFNVARLSFLPAALLPFPNYKASHRAFPARRPIFKCIGVANENQ